MAELRKISVADDVALAVLFRCSEQANSISGQSLAVAGGAQV